MKKNTQKILIVLLIISAIIFTGCSSRPRKSSSSNSLTETPNTGTNGTQKNATETQQISSDPGNIFGGKNDGTKYLSEDEIKQKEPIHIIKITENKGMKWRPVTAGQYIFWQQAPNNLTQNATDLFVYNTAAAQTRRIGLTISRFGNTIGTDEENLTKEDTLAQIMPVANDKYFFWYELSPKSKSTQPKMYVSPLTGSLAKKNIGTSVKPAQPSEFFLRHIDGTTGYFWSAIASIPNPGIYINQLTSFDTAQGKIIAKNLDLKGVKGQPLAIEQGRVYYLDKDALDKVQLKSYQLATGDFDITTLKTHRTFKTLSNRMIVGKKIISNTLPFSFFNMINGKLYWATSDYNKHTTSIRSYDLTTGVEALIKDDINGVYTDMNFTPEKDTDFDPRKADGPKFRGLGVSNKYLVFAITHSSNSDENGLFVLELQTGKIKNILTKTGIKLSWDLTTSSDLPFMIADNRIAFIGYEESKVLEDQSNVNVYMAEINQL